MHRRAPSEAAVIVRIFYLCAFFMVLDQHSAWVEMARRDSWALLWPVRWLDYTGAALGVPIVVVGALVASLSAAALPNVLLLRLSSALGLWEVGALWNSVGGYVQSHGFHAWIWVAVIFVMLPPMTTNGIGTSRRRRQLYLRVFWAAQAAILLFYSLSGAFKLAGAILQASNGEVNAFSADALARHTAARFLEMRDVGPFVAGQWILDHPRFGWMPYMTALYLEVFSIVVAFRPSLHRPWAAALILMHIGVYLTLGILFSWQILLVGLMLLTSPLAPKGSSAREVIAQLPLLSGSLTWLDRRFGRRRRRSRESWLHDGERPVSQATANQRLRRGTGGPRSSSWS